MVRIIRWAHLFSKNTLSASECREIRYPVSPFDFFEGDLFDRFIITSIIPLPASASLALSNGKFLAYLFVIILSIEVSGSALLKP